MPTLEVRVLSDRFEFVGHDSNSLIEYSSPDWQEILRKLLDFACEGRSLVVMSSWLPTVVQDFANSQEVPIPKQKWYHEQEYLCYALATCCTRAELDDMLESGEFELGSLVVTSAEDVSPQRCLDVYLGVDQRSEALYGGNDGVWITWKNPPKHLKIRCMDVLNEFVQEVGWEFVTARAQAGS